ncbi:hypothetical protein GC387_21045 [Pseudomonas sp. MWU12-2323]|nr:hypothetical protein [Pseudomonas sp. MWU12-2323]
MHIGTRPAPSDVAARGATNACAVRSTIALRETPSSSERKELERKLGSLRFNVRRLQLEYDLLMKANELIIKMAAIAINFIGTDTFTYTVSEGKLSTTATVILNVFKDRNCATSLMISSGAQDFISSSKSSAVMAQSAA